MNKQEKIIALENAKKELTPKAKFWNQNSLFLAFGFGSALMLMAGIELFRIWGKDYEFKLMNLGKLFGGWYFLGILIFFLFGLIICISCAKVIDGITKDVSTTLKTIEEEIKRVQSQK